MRFLISKFLSFFLFFEKGEGYQNTIHYSEKKIADCLDLNDWHKVSSFHHNNETWIPRLLRLKRLTAKLFCSTLMTLWCTLWYICHKKVNILNIVLWGHFFHLSQYVLMKIYSYGFDVVSVNVNFLMTFFIAVLFHAVGTVKKEKTKNGYGINETNIHSNIFGIIWQFNGGAFWKKIHAKCGDKRNRNKKSWIFKKGKNLNNLNHFLSIRLPQTRNPWNGSLHLNA